MKVRLRDQNCLWCCWALERCGSSPQTKLSPLSCFWIHVWFGCLSCLTEGLSACLEGGYNPFRKHIDDTKILVVRIANTAQLRHIVSILTFYCKHCAYSCYTKNLWVSFSKCRNFKTLIMSLFPWTCFKTLAFTIYTQSHMLHASARQIIQNSFYFLLLLQGIWPFFF